MTQTVAQAIAGAAEARANCERTGNTDWFIHWTTELQALEENELPSGSGIDNGTDIDFDATTGAKIVLRTAYHHMNDAGFYDGWTEHSVIVTPAFTGINVRVTGRDRNQIKDYLSQVFHAALSAEVPS